MKKIGIYLASNQQSGGIFQYNINFIKALNDLNFYFDVYYVYTDKIWEEYIPKNCKFFFLKKNIIEVLIFFLLKNFFLKKIIYFIILFLNKKFKFNLLSLKKKNNFLDKLKCEYFIFPSQDVISYKIKTKSIVAVHDLMHLFHPYLFEYRNGECELRTLHYNLIAKNSYRILVDSKFGKKHVLTKLKSSKTEQVKILPFCPTTYLHAKKNINVFKKYKIPKNYIFYPAHFWEHKNHEILVKAINISKQSGFIFNCVFVGGVKNNFNNILNLVKNLDLEDQFYFLGYVEEQDMYSLYKNALATTYVSILGPTNIPPLEAMFSGSPLLYSNVYAMKEQMRYAGIAINPYNAKQISNYLIKISTNRLFRKKMIQLGFKRIKEINYLNFRKKIYQILKQ
jgi:glycosyltransferase involved in cell wall biosynthesis